MLLFGCSSESGTQSDDPELEGELCVDVNDACCCDEELPFVEQSPSCRIGYAGDPSDWTLELVTETGASALPRLGSASECTASGGFYPSSTVAMELELCESTCMLRQSQDTRLRVLAGCPPTPC